MKHAILVIIAMALGLSLLGSNCHNYTSETKDRAAVDRQQQHYQLAQPIPFFDYSLERDVAIQLYKARNERVTTWTVWRSDTGVIEGDCPSIGYPIPYDTSLTNPLQGVGYHQSRTTIEQAEPNGLFSSKNSIATWVRCISQVADEDIEAPVYIESKVTAYPYPVEVNYETNRVKPAEGARPSVTIKSATEREHPSEEDGKP